MALNMVFAAALSPYIIRKLGPDEYGIWLLVLGVLDYAWLIDFGFRSATVKYTAEYHAAGQPEKVNAVLNTAVACMAVCSLVVLMLAVTSPQHVMRLFQIPADDLPAASRILLIIGVGWSFGLVFNMLSACLEGCQRFDLTNRIWILTSILRFGGTVALLATGHGLVAMALLLVGTQMVGYALTYVALRRAVPHWHPDLRVQPPVLRELLKYGRKTFVAIVGVRTLTQAPPLLIAYLLSPAFVAYYGLPNRMLQYGADAVWRIAMVSGSQTSAMQARGDLKSIAQLGIYVNRYSFVLFIPAGLLCLIYGQEIIRVWISPEFALQSAPLLPALTLGVGFASAGQYNSISILYGLGKHGTYAVAVLAEAILCVAALALLTPLYGIMAVAWATTALAIGNRCLFVAYLTSEALGIRTARYLLGIFGRPTAAAVVVAVAIGSLKYSLLPGDNVYELIAAALLTGAMYYAIAARFCTAPEHRELIWDYLLRHRGKRTRG